MRYWKEFEIAKILISETDTNYLANKRFITHFKTIDNKLLSIIQRVTRSLFIRANE